MRNAPVGLLICFLFWTGYRGIDFGNHWDEYKILNAVGNSAKTGVILPHWYNYPSVSYGIALSAIAPEGFRAVVDALGVIRDEASKSEKKSRLTEIADTLSMVSSSDNVKFRIRSVFLGINLLSVVWVYVLIVIWRRSRIEALVGAGILGLSWEVAYHARWIAPDGIQMQFVAFTALTMFKAIKSEGHRLLWLRCSAIGAGLACGTKYLGGVMLVPLLCVPFIMKKCDTVDWRWNSRNEALVISFIFFAVFLATTPGSLVEPMRFAYDTFGEIVHYASVGHGEHTVSRGLPHGALMTSYLSFVAFSHYWPIALAFFLFTMVGIRHVIKCDRVMAWVLLVAPVVYLVVLSSLEVMCVRNLVAPA